MWALHSILLVIALYGLCWCYARLVMYYQCKELADKHTSDASPLFVKRRDQSPTHDGQSKGTSGIADGSKEEF